MSLRKLIQDGNVENTLQYITQNDIVPNKTSTPKLYGFCPVSLSAESGKIQIMETLIAKGFSPLEATYIPQKPGPTLYPIHFACAAGHLDIVKSLIENHGVDLNVPDSEGHPPLWYIFQGRGRENDNYSFSVVKYLIEAGAPLRTVDTNKETYLHLAVRNETDPFLCEYIVCKGADVNARGLGGNTPLHVAVRFTERKVRTLLEAGADVNALNNDKRTPFLNAIDPFPNIKYAILNLLLEYGADPDIRDNTGDTALLYALRYGNFLLVRYLVVELNCSVQNNFTGLEDIIGHEFSMKLDSMVDRGVAVGHEYEAVRCMYVVVRAGFDLGQVLPDYDCEDLLTVLPEAEIEYLIENLKGNPRPLQNLCCLKIRRLLGRQLQRKAESLPLPTKLIDIVRMEDVPTTLWEEGSDEEVASDENDNDDCEFMTAVA